MAEDQLLGKTNRMNLLFDFYQSLLTDKQRMVMKYYFHDDYSLGEIAAEFDISRQAIYEHIKRAEALLEDYEHKLKLLAMYEKRSKTIEQLNKAVSLLPESSRQPLTALVEQLKSLD